MNHPLRAGLIVLSLAPCAIQPACAQNTFYAKFGLDYLDAGYITPSGDNAFYGVTRHQNGEHIYFYKLDQQGDLVWMKEATFSPMLFPTRIVALSDSSFAFLAVGNGSSYASYIFKVDDDGEFEWGRSLDIGSPANFQALAPTTDGGIILTGAGCLGADMIIHLDSDGHIVSQHGHSSFSSAYDFPNAIDMVHDGNNHYAYMGYAADPGNTYWPLIFFRSDSAGTVYNYREIHFPLGPAHYWPLGKSIVRSTNGGHYIAVAVDDPMYTHHVVLMYLNAQDELVWSRDIATTDDHMGISSLCPTDDGGCVIVGNNMLTPDFPVYYGTYAIKFDEQGDPLWSTSVGDVGMTGWDRVSIQSLMPASDGGLMTVPVRYGAFDICRVDAAFNGYCYTTPFEPVITDPAATMLPYTVTATAINFIEGTIDAIAEPSSFLRTNVCSSTGIREARTHIALTMMPNPASDRVQLVVPIDRPQRVDVSLTNALGVVCSTHRYEAVPDQPLLIDTNDLSPGAYGVEVRMHDMRQRATLVVQH